MSDDLQPRALSVAEWPLIAPIMRETFRNAMPVTPQQGGFIGATDTAGELAGFVQLEQLFHLQCLYVARKYRHTRLAWAMMRRAAGCIPPGHSAIVLTDTQPAPGDAQAERLLQKLGARDLGQWRFFRKDF